MTFLSVIVPAYNEEKRIGLTLTKIYTYLKDQNYSSEIIVIDDGSQDRTAQLVDTFQTNKNIRLLKNKFNQGKGHAVKRGMLAAKGKFILFTDADLSTPISEIEKLMRWADQGYSIVIGSRGLPQSNVVVRQKIHRETMGRLFNILVQAIVFRGIKDTQCGFKYFRRDIGREIFKSTTLHGFCFDVEVLYVAAQLGYQIKEVPVYWYNSSSSKVKIPQDVLKMFFDLFRIKIMHRYKSKSL